MMKDGPTITAAQTPAPPDQAALPSEICGYVVDSALTLGSSFLAIGPGGRGVVLKQLDSECLLRGLLHPSIRERLSRVRELAHPGVANLHGVGREGGRAYLIWEYVPGTSFDQWMAAAHRSPHQLTAFARELILSVDSLHMQGIIHGAVTGSNVIIDPAGGVRLTHVSPLLYTDPLADVESVVALLEDAVQARGEQDMPLGQLLAEARRDEMPLRVVGARVAALIEARQPDPPPQARDADDRTTRRRSRRMAVAVAILGIVGGIVLWTAVDRGTASGTLRLLTRIAAAK